MRSTVCAKLKSKNRKGKQFLKNVNSCCANQHHSECKHKRKSRQFKRKGQNETEITQNCIVCLVTSCVSFVEMVKIHFVCIFTQNRN